MGRGAGLLPDRPRDAMAAESTRTGPGADLSPEVGEDDGDATGRPVNGAAPGREAGSMAELRHLLVGPEREAIEEVRERVDALGDDAAQAERVGRVLPEAIALRTGQDDQLARALGPTIERTLKRSVERDPAPLVEALFPVIGPAIRKGIREALSQLLVSINHTLEHSLSPRSLRWRFEAWQTDQSFAEIVLRNTLLYRVEQLFLIDRATGLPLAHAHADAVETQDSALVSGMLTAIQDFVHDSFEDASGGGMLEALRVGELTVWIEPGPKAVLAAVLRGHPSPALRETLRDLVETAHLRLRPELDAFDGDTTPFDGATQILESGLVLQYREPERRGASPVVWVALAGAAVLLAAWLILSALEQRRWAGYLDVLDAEPGLVVIDDGREAGRRTVRGLRDPLAAEPGALLAAAGLDTSDVRAVWQPYQSLDTSIVRRRAARLLEAPASVSLRVEDGVLVASGAASAGWRSRARARAPLIGGVAGFDDSAMLGAQLQALADSMGAQSVRFRVGTPEVLPGQGAAVDRLVALVRELTGTASEAGRPVRVRVVGHASDEGPDAVNQRLSQQRAEAIVALLVSEGVPAETFEAVGTGRPREAAGQPDAASPAFHRSTAFQVILPDE